MSKNSKIFLGILGAATAGVVIGLLIAPEKGKDMRKKIKKTADKWSDNLTHMFHKEKENLKQKAQAAKENMS
ncbi:MAG TPA: YtxH domain-containing protein [Chitinophagaceae bacterium]|nr:YtxH domain-containing protein [Chitinophagaceae bacterium]